MDLLMTDQWLTPILDLSLTSEEREDDTALNSFLGEQGFQSKLLLFNLGSTLIFFSIQILLLMMSGVSFYIRSCSNVSRNVFNFLRERVIWASTIRIIIQQFQPLLMSSILNISSFTLPELENKSSGMKLNFSFSVIMIVVLVLSLAAFSGIIYKGKAFENQISPLIEGIWVRKGSLAIYWTVITLLKWSILSLILILLTDYPSQQIQSLTLLSLLSTCLQLLLQPQLSPVEYRISLFNEYMSLFYLYALAALALADTKPARNTMGIVLLSITLGTFFVNLVKAVVCVGRVCVRRCNACRNMVIAKKYAVERVEETGRQSKIVIRAPDEIMSVQDIM
ncbi:hypothetical protein FGO68_gene9500 [Halteria grandinella]|uniref:Uncharacterized protein n=1 Tax=Halteria grandinella TaxID=5974 RepID=A0A8J8T930_HALGN|nr:hypothetical protein FGO68_gene9500 [Halteria grandinella]